MKNPILVIGFLLMIIFLINLSKKSSLRKYRNRLIPTSCKAVLVKLNKRISANWKTKCNKNNLEILIIDTNDKQKITENQLNAYLYRELANNIIFVAKNSPGDNLERTDVIHFEFQSHKKIVNAITIGKDLVKFQTLKSTKMIIDHLKSSVSIQQRSK